MTELDNEKEIYFRPTSIVITLPDPDAMPVAYEQGGTLQWRTDSHQYLNFRIEFDGPNPDSGTSDPLPDGTDVKPVVIKLNNLGENYVYHVIHSTRAGNVKRTGPFAFRVRTCDGCL